MGWLKKIVGSLTGANAAKKAQEAAIRAQEEAAKRDVTVQAVAADPVQLQQQAEREADEASQSARRRRFGISSTVRDGGLLARGLLGGRRTLG